MSKDPKTNTDTSLPSNAEKDPNDWATGAETMTGAQASYLKTLCEEAGEPFDPHLNKAEASKRNDALQAKTGRGRDHGGNGDREGSEAGVYVDPPVRPGLRTSHAGCPTARGPGRFHQ